MALANPNINNYKMIQEMTGDNRKLQINLMEKAFQNREGLNATMCLEFLEEKYQIIEHSKKDEYDFQSKEKELKEKLMLNHKMEKNRKK